MRASERAKAVELWLGRERLSVRGSVDVGSPLSALGASGFCSGVVVCGGVGKVLWLFIFIKLFQFIVLLLTNLVFLDIIIFIAI